jgi:hypothetical protein
MDRVGCRASLYARTDEDEKMMVKKGIEDEIPFPVLCDIRRVFEPTITSCSRTPLNKERD